MVPTLAAPLGVTGHRPTVGTKDCKDLLYVFCVVNLISAALHSNTLESLARAKQKTGKSTTARMQQAFADHPRHVGRVYPKHTYKEVVILYETPAGPNTPGRYGVSARPPHHRTARAPALQ